MAAKNGSKKKAATAKKATKKASSKGRKATGPGAAADPSAVKLGAKLERLRGERTQADVAYNAGIGQATLWRIEKGHGCRPATLAKIAKALKVPVDSLT